MSERFFETPETNVKGAALKLLRFKAMSQMCEGKTTCTLDEADVNEILLVGGMPLITPDEFKVPELKVIKTEKEELEYGDTI